MVMTRRENYEALVNHEPTDWVPNVFTDIALMGGQLEYWENGPIEGGADWFGNVWIPTESAGGQPALDPDAIPLDDVCDWEDKVVFPDLDKIDWNEYSAKMLAGVNRKDQFIEYHTWNSVYLRFGHLLGFEEALCAFYEEPEAAKALCDAIADYKIGLIERVAKYIKPDAYVHYDDVATDRDLFMSPDIYREFIMPGHKRMNEAAKSFGILPEIHVCGKCESIIPELIEEGSVAWQSAQPMNDIESIIENYGDRIAAIGGYDTQGPCAQASATDEMIVDEVRRCMDTYGRFGRSYGFIGVFLGSMSDPNIAHKYGVMFAEAARYAGAPMPEGPATISILA